MSKNKNVLILVKEINHGRQLWEKIPGSTFIHGDGTTCMFNKKKKCEHYKIASKEVQKKFNNNEIGCLIGTSIIGEGTDLIPVDALIKLNMGASKGMILQNIGRGLRISDTKDSVDIYDVDFTFNETMSRHANIRRNVYREIGTLLEGRLDHMGGIQWMSSIFL